MDRRRFLALAGSTVVATAGCLTVDAPGTADTHPLAGTTQTVRVDKDSDSPWDLDANAQQALAFWEEHSEEYAGFPIAFELVEEEPDIVIAYADSPRGCENVENYSERVLGCAPLIRPGRQVSRPITARVVAANRPFGKIRITTKHEIGHVLGLGHDDQPLRIMSNRPEDRIPRYQHRIEIWETVLEVNEQTGDATRLLNHGLEVYGDGAYEAAARTFEAVAGDLAVAQDRIETAIALAAEFEDDPDVETVALDRLQETLETVRDRTIAAGELAAALEASARAGSEDDEAGREEALDRAVEHANAFNAIERTPLRDIAVSLGLVRGFDRDEPVVDFEEGVPEE